VRLDVEEAKVAVPDFQSLMLPLLKLNGDAQEHNVGEATEALARVFALSEEDRREMLASGVQTKLVNRISWARTYLQKAGLIESTGRARFRITARGLQVLNENPDQITIKFLKKFPDFVEFLSSRVKTEKEDKESGQTPEEVLEASYQGLRQALAQDLLEHIKRSSPSFFENLVVDLLVAMGYGGSRADAGQAIGRSGDEGIDGVIKEDKLGLDVVYVQAKRWENTTVGAPIVQAFAGSLMGQKANKGVFITTSQFSRDAQDYVKKIQQKIVLIDGEQLAQLMIDHNIGVTEVASYTIKKLDMDYFEG